MKHLILALAPLALAGCGSTKDFTVEVARSENAVRAEIGALDSALLPLIGLKPFRKAEGEQPGTYRYIIPSEKGYADGEVVFWVSEIEPGHTRVDVAVDLAQVRSGNTYLSDAKAEAALKDIMAEWAAGSAGGVAAKTKIEFALAGFAFASQRFASNSLPTIPAGFDTAAFDGLFSAEGDEGAGGWGDDSGAAPSDQYGTEHEFGDPMVDTETASSDYSSDEGMAVGDPEAGGWGE